jgi:DNA modification methylase
MKTLLNTRRWEVRHTDCLKALPKLSADSIDAIVTDPPYGLEFMGKEWDRIGDVKRARRGETSGLPTGPGSGRGTSPTAGRPGFDLSLSSQRSMQEWHERWAIEALRVLKPGGHLLAFGGTRTFHRLTCALEDAGFEIRDCLCWLYGSGFPKSLNVAVAIDKAAGHSARGRAIPVASTHLPSGRYASEKLTANRVEPYRARSKAAVAWQGWGTGLKPAWEPIVIARKPMAGTVAQNVRRYRTGALNIDGCRVAFESDVDECESKTKNRHADFNTGPRENRVYGCDKRIRGNYDPPGRWPANVLLSHTGDCQKIGHCRVRSHGHHPRARGAGGLGTAGHRGQRGLIERRSSGEPVERWDCSPACPVRLLDEGSGVSHSSGGRTTNISKGERVYGGGRGLGRDLPGDAVRGDPGFGDKGGASRFFYCAKASRTEREAGFSSGHTGNTHPTVKPIRLMRWLVRLATPPGGIVLDPFAGSGSTGCAALLEGARFLGIEREAAYIPIARARITHWARSRSNRPMEGNE